MISQAAATRSRKSAGTGAETMILGFWLIAAP
jgi:hypothetical protein